jgi:hypothetical protein
MLTIDGEEFSRNYNIAETGPEVILIEIFFQALDRIFFHFFDKHLGFGITVYDHQLRFFRIARLECGAPRFGGFV